MGLLLAYLMLALGVSFLCSVMEAVLLSAPMSFVNMKENQGVKSATVFKRLKQNIDRPISAILTLNTIAHTVGAAGVGAQATTVFGEAYFGLISAVLTLLILILSEILPKTVGAYYWKNLFGLAGHIIQWMVYITYPFVIASEFMTRIISGKSKEEATVSREEVSAMVDIGTNEGTFASTESKIIQNLIKLRNVRAEDVMTPRVVVATASEEMTLEEFSANKNFLHFSRIPVYSGNPENITGFVYRQVVLENLANDRFGIKLSEIRKPIMVAPNIQPLTVLWERLLAEKTHITMIVDEYGGFEGIVTLEDIIETILGLEIMDERDVAADMQQYARERWKERAEKYKHLPN
ncbi:MAG: hemolysin [Bacteroidetes bacterium HGW-Bacteroidetes-14]|jgi:CBS domain containing-hemolysin-like protein|nr:MAG: hemolysin [Bacteroidetes bacterium HGW-Bacteroidetes-14]